MTDYSFSLAPPGNWAEAEFAHSAFFHSREWQNLLRKAFDISTIYGTDQDNKCVMAISAFHAGPFSVGYIGFPIGGIIDGSNLTRPRIEAIQRATMPRRLHCLRISVSPFTSMVELDLPFESNPETAIINLQQWDLTNVSKKLRRDVKKAANSDLVVSEASDTSEGRHLYDMYAGTVRRNNGNLRYNEVYFKELVRLSLTQSNIRCLLARKDDNIAGFVIIVQDRQFAYYLHGGANIKYRTYSPSDLLLYEAILWAKQQGNDCFDLMTSPPNQATLLKYKEKWGAETRQHRTYTLPMAPGYHLFQFCERIYPIVKKLKRIL